MARFDKLEFNEKRKPPPGPAQPPPQRARPLESDWMKDAGESRRTGLYENALKYYSRALEVDKSQVAGWLGQVQMLVLLEEYPEAELWSRKAMELFPANGDLMAGRAQAFCRLGNSKQSQALCDGALQQIGQSAYRWMVRGEIMIGSKADADQHCFDKAQEIDGDWLVPLETALVYLHYRTPGKALPRARRAVELAPERFYAWYVRGLCEFKVGLSAAAKKSLQTCSDLCPGHGDARRLLVELYQPGRSFWRWLRRLFRRS